MEASGGTYSTVAYDGRIWWSVFQDPCNTDLDLLGELENLNTAIRRVWFGTSSEGAFVAFKK
jgi:hypothetical protein